MNVFNLLGACSVAVLGGFKTPIKKNATSIDSYSTESIVKFTLDTDNASYKNVNSAWSITAYYFDNTQYLGNKVLNSNNFGQYGYDLFSAVNNGASTYSDYWLGYVDIVNEYNDSNSILTGVYQRLYFVNSGLFPSSTYYLEDRTWSDLKDVLNSASAGFKNQYFGGWINFLSPNLTYNFVSNSPNYWVQAGNNIYNVRLYDSKTTSAIEPQRHYGDTYTSLDNSTGGLITVATPTFLNYNYLLYYHSNGYFALGRVFWSIFSSTNTHIYFELNKNPTGQDLFNAEQNGYNQGYQAGYGKGHDDGVDEASVEAYNMGYHAGEIRGYDEGYYAGVNSPTYSFASFFGAIADTPVLIIRKLFDFDVFGVSALSVILSCFTAIILIYIARKII